MGTRIARLGLYGLLSVGLLSIGAGNMLGAANAQTMADLEGLELQYPGQIELGDFVAQTGTALTFSENPIFSARVSAGELPAVADRLPAEPLVVVPLEQIGAYGGTLRGTALALESGTSEVLSWRQVNLVRLNPVDNTIVPNVAKSWVWNDDNTEITFTLRRGHKWSDGEPFNADDIVFFVNDILGDETLTASVWGSWSAGDERVRAEKIDDLTVKIIFSQPNPIFLSYLATSGSYFTPWAAEHVLKQLHIKYNPNADIEAKAAGFEDWASRFKTFYNKWKDAVTATEFGLQVPTLESHVLAEATDGQTRNFVANPYYFKVDTAGNQLPYIDRQNERFLDTQIWTLEVISGNIDQKSQNVNLENFPIFKENEARGDYTVQLNSGQIGPVLIFNFTVQDPSKKAVYADPRFRQAMSVAINREELNDQLFLGLASLDQAMPAGIPFATEADRRFMTAFDPDLANKLLDDVGMTQRDADGFRMAPDGTSFKVFWEFSLQFTRSPEFPVLIAENWRTVGVNVLLKEIPTTLLRQKENLNELDISMEWDLPFEWNLISEVVTYSPPWGASTPLTGKPWMTYWETDGAEGEEPPAWAARLREVGSLFQNAKQGSDEYNRLGAEMVKLNLENMVIIGTAGSVPQINVVSNKLANTPDWNLNAYRVGFAYPYQADQWAFK